MTALHRLNVAVAGAPETPLPDAAPKVRCAEHAEVARMSAREIVARHDLSLAVQRFRDMLAAADAPSLEAERIAERYATACETWRDAEVADAPAIRETRSSELGSDALRLLEAGLDVFEIAGTIKWFDAAKGYGFIATDNGVPDVLLHVTCLRASGYQTAHDGARVRAEVLRRPKGIQAFRILNLDETTAVDPSTLPARTHVLVHAESDWERAVVKWYNRVRGFGFLSRGEGTPDIFVHMETIQRFGFTELRPGQTVQVRWGMGDKGAMAAELRPDDGRTALATTH